MNHIDWSITNFFGTLGTPTIEAPLSTPTHKIKIIVLPYGLPFQFINMRVELWANYMGIEVRCYWERTKEQLGNLRRSMRTPWEDIGNEGGKKSCSPSSPKEKNWTPHECMLSLLVGCMKLLFPKLFVTIFGLG
jgi:hypothetical protein